MLLYKTGVMGKYKDCNMLLFTTCGLPCHNIGEDGECLLQPIEEEQDIITYKSTGEITYIQCPKCGSPAVGEHHFEPKFKLCFSCGHNWEQK